MDLDFGKKASRNAVMRDLAGLVNKPEAQDKLRQKAVTVPPPPPTFSPLTILGHLQNLNLGLLSEAGCCFAHLEPSPEIPSRIREAAFGGEGATQALFRTESSSFSPRAGTPGPREFKGSRWELSPLPLQPEKTGTRRPSPLATLKQQQDIKNRGSMLWPTGLSGRQEFPKRLRA